MIKTRFTSFLFCLALLSVWGCEGPAGNDGANGTSCAITDNGDGSKTIRCADGTSAVIHDGNNGFSGATGATGSAGDTGEAGDDGEDGDDGIDGTDCTVTQNDDGTATITCEDGTTAIVGVPTTTATDAGSSEPVEEIDAGITEEVADAGASETLADGGVSETLADGGTSDTVADGGVVQGTADAGAPPTCEELAGNVFISEYVEGDSNNKAVELFNGGDSEVDLSLYQLVLIQNGGAWADEDKVITMSDTLPAGEVFVVCHSSATQAIKDECDLETGSLVHNGNDAIGLFACDTLVDAVGKEGVDPGDSFVVGAGSTEDYTLVRACNIDTGDFDWDSQSGETWNIFPENTFAYLGTHESPCEDCNGVPGGTALADGCGVCDEDPTNDCVQDCNGEFGGLASIDACGECVGGTTGLVPCIIDAGPGDDEPSDDEPSDNEPSDDEPSEGDSCAAGTWDDDSDALTPCIAHTVTDCDDGQLLSPGTSTSDGSCTDCSAGFYDHDSNPSSDCVAHTVTDCDIGQTLTIGTITADGYCTDCAAGEYDDDSDALTPCIAHMVTDCADGQTLTAPTATTDGSCADCDANTYDDDGDATTACIAHTVCDGNATETSAGDATTDAACECNTGYFGDGTSCAMHTACDANASETTPGTSTTDAACECNTGYFGDGTSCAMHTACDANATEITPGTSTTDAACECNTGFFGDGAGCDPTKNLGEACTDNAECTSGICDNSVCAPVPPMHLGASGCTYTSYVLSDGTLLCGTNDKTAKYYTNGTGTALSADLDLDGTSDVEYRSGGTWTTWASDLGSSTPTFAENPANGDIYYTGLVFDGGATTTIWKSEGGVLGAQSEFATGLDVEVFDSGITSDTTYLYARTGIDEVTRYEMATGTTTVIATSGIPSADSMAVGDQYIYISTEHQIFRVDKVNGGAGEVIAGTGVAGDNYAADGVDATTVAITIPSKSVASVVQGRVYFVDQSGYTGGKVRYITPDGTLETVEEIESSINRGVFVRGNLAYAKTYEIAAPIAP